MELFFLLKGEVKNVQNGRVYDKGNIIGQDDILFWRKRASSWQAVSTVFTVKLDRDTFEHMCKEFPLIKKELFEEANFRAMVNRYCLDI